MYYMLQRTDMILLYVYGRLYMAYKYMEDYTWLEASAIPSERSITHYFF